MITAQQMQAIDLNIYLGNGYRNIKLTDKVRTSNAVYSFCNSNGLRHAVVKSGGGWYIIQMDGTLKFWCRALAYVTFEDLYLVLTMKHPGGNAGKITNY